MNLNRHPANQRATERPAFPAMPQQHAMAPLSDLPQATPSFLSKGYRELLELAPSWLKFSIARRAKPRRGPLPAFAVRLP